MNLDAELLSDIHGLLARLNEYSDTHRIVLDDAVVWDEGDIVGTIRWNRNNDGTYTFTQDVS